MEDDFFGIVGSLQDGAFRVEQVVAEGGFAVVYRAHHEGFRADVALKCLKLPGMLSESKQQEFLEKFRAEGELLFRLSAAIPAVVRPLHLGTLKSSKSSFVPFIALEWLDGKNLDAFIETRKQQGKPPLEARRAVQLLAPAARALEQAHHFAGPDGTVSILHRDIKPENLFVAKLHGREVVKVLDFGIGKVKRVATQIAGHASLEQSSFSAFTPAYGAPEQWLPKRFGQTGTWTDVWGLALTLVELLTGKTPLEGDAHAVMGAAIDESLRPTPRSLGLHTSDGLEAIFQRALAVDPRRRYHEIGDFWNDLEAELGVSTTRAWATPANLSSLPPARPEQAAARPAAELELEIPDLDSAPVSRGQGSGARARPAPGSRVEAFDALDTELSDSRVDAIPNIGGFRLDAPGGLSDALELTTTAVEARARPAVARHIAIVPPRKSLMQGLAGPLKLLLLAALVTGIDWVYTVATGETLQLGPARLFWLSGPLAVLAIVKMIFRLAEQ